MTCMEVKSSECAVQLSHGSPLAAVCARGDLDNTLPDARGCFDTKVTSYELALELQADAITGPTTAVRFDTTALFCDKHFSLNTDDATSVPIHPHSNVLAAFACYSAALMSCRMACLHLNGPRISIACRTLGCRELLILNLNVSDLGLQLQSSRQALQHGLLYWSC